ncbi:MAG: rod shape-determining protein MreC [Verrucomicrobiota bacterium]|nr:rod shape-determining protein MreC [Verrucomicrobiota bacterium]
MRNKKLLIGLSAMVILVLLNLPLSVSLRIKCDAQDNVAPFQRFIRFLIEKGRNTFRPLADARKAIEEKQKMLEDIANLTFQLRNLRVLEQENALLRKELAFKGRQKRALVMCEVISRGGTSGWWQTVRLDRGRRHGIGPDMAVITADGIIGRTGGVAPEGEEPSLAVGDLTCDVLLITDPNCKVACRFPRTGALGILRGMGVSAGGDAQLEILFGVQPCQLDYISRTREILPGDEIVTSGLGGVFPEGLLVGHVARVEMDRSGLYQRAEVAPGAHLEGIKHAFVVAPRRGAPGPAVEEEAGK